VNADIPASYLQRAKMEWEEEQDFPVAAFELIACKHQQGIGLKHSLQRDNSPL